MRSTVAMRLLGLLCLAVLAAVHISADPSTSDAAPDTFIDDIPRVKAASLQEFRHLQFFNKDFHEWVKTNIKVLDYVCERAVYQHRWDELPSPMPKDQQEVVLVTQATISRNVRDAASVMVVLSNVLSNIYRRRLHNFAVLAAEWGGPISLAIYLNQMAGTPEAAACRDRVVDFMQDFNKEHSMPLTVSFVFSRTRPDDGDVCGVPPPIGSPPTEASPTSDTPGSASRKQSGPRRGGVQSSRPLEGVQGRRVHSHRGRADRWLWQGPDEAALAAAAAKAGADGSARRSLISTQPDGTAELFSLKGPRATANNMRISTEPFLQLYDGMYPVNTLRNVAFDEVPSGAFVFLLDADFVPTPSLHEDLVSGVHAPHLAAARAAFDESRARRAFILPAFELFRDGVAARARAGAPCDGDTGCKTLDGMQVPRTFASLVDMMHGDAVDVFHRRQFVSGHLCYSWMTWLQDPAPAELLESEYKHPCEPYVIALKDAMPRYDERFRGRGMNKVQQLTHMAMWGFEWRVLPADFVLHLPHESEGGVSKGGWDTLVTPLVLMSVKMREIEQEPEFKHHVQQDVPIPF